MTASGGCGTYKARVCDHVNLIRFSGMSNLINLKIKNIRPHSFYDLPNLRHLEIKSCNLSKLDKNAFLAMPNLESLHITHDNCFSNLQQLRNISLESLHELKRLKIYDPYDYDVFQVLPPNISILIIDGLKKERRFKHKNIQVMHIILGSFHSFDAKMLSDLPSLRHLRLEMKNKCYMSFVEINLNYEFLSQLETLSIEFLDIKQVNFSRLVNLKYLELIGNQYKVGCTDESQNEMMIHLVPSTFSELKALEEMHLENLILTNSDLEGVFSNLKQLRVLDLSKNRIKSIDVKTFNGLEKLTRLEIKENDLDNVKPDEFLTVFPKLEELTLSAGNRSEDSKQEFLVFFDSRLKKVVFV